MEGLLADPAVSSISREEELHWLAVGAGIQLSCPDATRAAYANLRVRAGFPAAIPNLLQRALGLTARIYSHIIV